MARRFKFPEPKHYKPEEPAILCPGERVLKLYNQDSGAAKDAAKISKTVRKWFATAALKRGWAGVHFLREVQTTFGAGCVLWRPPEKIDVTIKVTADMLVLTGSLPANA